MAVYPETLLPKRSYPILSNEEISDCAFVRETLKDLYLILEKHGYTTDDILPFVVAPQPSLREVFELSVFLYGYYDERHIGIRITDAALYDTWRNEQIELPVENIQFSQNIGYPLFLSASRLNVQEIDFNGERYTLSFSHKPTRANYWHFELWTADSTGTRIPRNKSNAHTKYLAKSLLEYIMAEAVVTKSSIKPFKRDDFDRAMRKTTAVL